MATNEILTGRKHRIEHRLKERGIHNYTIKYLPYLEYDSSEFATAREIGIRMIILSQVAYVPHETEAGPRIKAWLEAENLWTYVTQKEKKLFEGEKTDTRTMIDFSWEVESAYTLAWCVNLIPSLHEPIKPLDDDQIELFVSKMYTVDPNPIYNIIPFLTSPIERYLRKLTLRNPEEIFEENIVNELATTYFRDIMISQKKNESDINIPVSFQRHKALNWVRRFEGITDWDHVDTST